MFIPSAPIISETVSAAAVLILLFAFPAVLLPFFLRKKPVLRVFALLPLFFLLPRMAAYAADSGTCGVSCTWTLADDGTLTVSGTGEMADFSDQGTPWSIYRNDIKTVVINSGVTSIGESSFILCENLSTVNIPDSVTKIGNNAFYKFWPHSRDVRRDK